MNAPKIRKAIIATIIFTGCQNNHPHKEGFAKLTSSQSRTTPNITTTQTLIAGDGFEEDRFGYHIAGGGDINGDGFDDALVGFAGTWGRYPDGSIYVYMGSLSGLIDDPAILTPSDSKGKISDGIMGFGRGAISDTNMDGYAEIFVGAPTYDNIDLDSGSLYIYTKSKHDYTEEIIVPPSGINSFCWIVSEVNDVNGDDYNDIMCTCNTTYSKSEGTSGCVFILYGSTSGISSKNTDFIVSPVTPYTYTYSDYFANSADGSGDINGDGFYDIVIGAHNDQAAGYSQGAAYIYYGSPSGIITDGVKLKGLDINVDKLGSDVAGAGDLNGDGYDDVIIGATHSDYSGADSGAVFIHYGSLSGIQEVPDKLLASDGERHDVFGQDVDSAGDLDGDGYSDIVVGSLADDAFNDTIVYVYYGASSGLADLETQLRSPTPDQGAGFGMGLAGVGDVNADGYDDLLIGEYGYDGKYEDMGAAHLFLGAPEDNDGDGVGIREDCDDYDSSIGAAAHYFVDGDGDGFGDPLSKTAEASCTPVKGRVPLGGDCDDTEATIFPGAEEVCGDGIDNNCDGFGLIADDEDSDGLSSKREAALGTDPCNPDSDGDGRADGDEVAQGTDPLKPDQQDTGDTEDSGTPDELEDTDTAREGPKDRRCGCHSQDATAPAPALLSVVLLVGFARRRRPSEAFRMR